MAGSLVHHWLFTFLFATTITSLSQLYRPCPFPEPSLEFLEFLMSMLVFYLPSSFSHQLLNKKWKEECMPSKKTSRDSQSKNKQRNCRQPWFQQKHFHPTRADKLEGVSKLQLTMLEMWCCKPNPILVFKKRKRRRKREEGEKKGSFFFQDITM